MARRCVRTRVLLVADVVYAGKLHILHVAYIPAYILCYAWRWSLGLQGRDGESRMAAIEYGIVVPSSDRVER